jgi:hypothetical protein
VTTQGLGAGSKEAFSAAVGGRAELANHADSAVVGSVFGGPWPSTQPMLVSGKLSHRQHAERDGRASRTQSHDQIDVAGLETERDPPIGP